MNSILSPSSWPHRLERGWAAARVLETYILFAVRSARDPPGRFPLPLAPPLPRGEGLRAFRPPRSVPALPLSENRQSFCATSPPLERPASNLLRYGPAPTPVRT